MELLTCEAIESRSKPLPVAPMLLAKLVQKLAVKTSKRKLRMVTMTKTTSGMSLMAVMTDWNTIALFAPRLTMA